MTTSIASQSDICRAMPVWQWLLWTLPAVDEFFVPNAEFYTNVNCENVYKYPGPCTEHEKT